MPASPRRILQILPDGSLGGGGTAVLGLCSDLLAEGSWDVALITAPGSPVAEQATRDGITIFPIDFFTSRLDFRVVGRLAHCIDEFRPDLVHAHGARAALPFCSRRLRHGTRLAYTVHGFHHARKPFPLRQLGRLAERHIATRADAVIFVSEGDREQAVRERTLPRDSRKGSIVVNGIDPSDFEEIVPSSERFDLIFAGRAHPQKNPFFMVEIMEALHGSGIRLRMICGGELEGPLKARIAASPASDSISFTSALPREDVLGVFLSAKLLVMPSLWEGLPIAPIEALYCGLPVIASNIRGTDEVVIDGVNGRLIDGFDAMAYAHAIREILGNDALRGRMVTEGRRRVEDRFLRSASSVRHEAIYQSLLRSS
jgi:glycosyltransferase involved in cell wall biosynthesis